MSIPDYQSLMLPLLRCVADGEKPVQFTIRSLADELQLAPEDLEATLPGGTPVFSSRVQWAGTYLVQATLLARPRRGVLQITERGRSVLAEGPQKNRQRAALSLSGIQRISPEVAVAPRKGKRDRPRGEARITNHVAYAAGGAHRRSAGGAERGPPHGFARADSHGIPGIL